MEITSVVSDVCIKCSGGNFPGIEALLMKHENWVAFDACQERILMLCFHAYVAVCCISRLVYTARAARCRR